MGITPVQKGIGIRCCLKRVVILKERLVNSVYCLWFGANKIYDLQQLVKYFDFDAAEMYFLGGGLSRWLRQCGENELAAQVDRIDVAGDISAQLAKVFNVPLPENRSNAPCDNTPVPTSSNSSFGVSFQNASFAADSFGLTEGSFSSEALGALSGSFQNSAGPFETGSFQNILGSFETTSFGFETLFSQGSFNNIYTSFFTTSFKLHQYEYEFSNSFTLTYTSFNTTSFNIFRYQSSFETGSFNLGSFNTGSFGTTLPEALPAAREAVLHSESQIDLTSLTAEEKIILNITSCNLNRYGYGLHLI